MAPLSWAQLVVGHLPRSGPRLRTTPRISVQHQVGKEASTTLPPDGATWGPHSPRHNHNMKGECSSHDDVSPVDGRTVVGNQPPL
jgi:hypothetical protein